jgi:hypothetical protein
MSPSNKDAIASLSADHGVTNPSLNCQTDRQSIFGVSVPSHRVAHLCRPLTRAQVDGAECPRGSSALRAFVTAGLQSDARYAGFTAVRPRSGRQIVAQGKERRRRDAALG